MQHLVSTVYRKVINNVIELDAVESVHSIIEVSQEGRMRSEIGSR